MRFYQIFCLFFRPPPPCILAFVWSERPVIYTLPKKRTPRLALCQQLRSGGIRPFNITSAHQRATFSAFRTQSPVSVANTFLPGVYCLYQHPIINDIPNAMTESAVSYYLSLYRELNLMYSFIPASGIHRYNTFDSPHQ